MAQDKKTKVDPMLEGQIEPGMGELDNTPTEPSPEFLREVEPLQDPQLRGTGQKGELEGTPTKPSDEYLKELEDFNQVLMDEVSKGFTLDQAMAFGFGMRKKLNKEGNDG
jgi:hypothetical protein